MEIWEAVQLEIERRRVFAEKYGIVKLDYAMVDNSFAGRVICGCTFGRKVWNSTKEEKRVEEFDIDIYFKIIEKMIVFEGNRIIVGLLDGTQVECEIE